MRRSITLLALTVVLPVAALAQSAGEVERCFQNPTTCHPGGIGATPAPTGPSPAPAAGAGGRVAVLPDYATVLHGPEADRRRIQESLRTLDKYNGPIDGNLQSEATQKAISEWQKGRNTPPVGKLTPQEAQQLNAEASRAPIRRIEPPPQVVTPTPIPPAPTPPSNADALKSLQARLAERRKAAEPKAEAASQALIRDLKAYVAADGKGVAGEQFAAFAKWYADNKAAGRTIGDITPAIDDYGDAKTGSAVSSEINFQTRQGDASFAQCLVFAWIEGTPRKNPQVFSCDDVAAVEKWKTDQSLRSAWR